MGENARLLKLRFTNQVERKYLVFDYKKFFLKGLQFENVPFGDIPDDLSSSDTSSEIKTPPKEIPQYEPSLKSSESEPETEDDRDKIPPQAHSFTDKPSDITIKPHTPENNPIDLLSQDDKRNDNYDTQSKDSDYDDGKGH